MLPGPVTRPAGLDPGMVRFGPHPCPLKGATPPIKQDGMHVGERGSKAEPTLHYPGAW
ncbi:hypothetical protein GCM10009731_26340 [Streptomyces globosus]